VEAYFTFGLVNIICLNEIIKFASLKKTIDILASIEAKAGIDPENSVNMATMFHLLGLAYTRKKSVAAAIEYLVIALKTRITVYGSK
jgi:hypothetical protein